MIFAVLLTLCLVIYNGVHVTGQQQQCTDRFMELDLIKYRAVNTKGDGTRLNNKIRFITEYQFNCSSTNITSVILGINVRLPTNSRTMFPSIQLYRPGAGNISKFNYGVVDERVIYHTSSNVSTSGVYEYPLDPPITVNNGDVLAVSQPTRSLSIVRVYYISNSQIMFKSNQLNNNLFEDDITNQLLLIYPVTNGSCVNSSNSINDSIIKQNALRVDGTRNITQRRQYLYPQMTFSCNGTITKWIYGGIVESGGRLPELQIWRQLGTNNFIKVNSSLVNVSTPIDTDVYEFIPQSPLEFQEGDIFGVYVPKTSESKISLWEQRQSGPINLRINGTVDNPLSTITEALVANGNDFPLVTAEISIITPSIDLSTTSVITATTATIHMLSSEILSISNNEMISAITSISYNTTKESSSATNTAVVPAMTMSSNRMTSITFTSDKPSLTIKLTAVSPSSNKVMPSISYTSNKPSLSTATIMSDSTLPIIISIVLIVTVSLLISVVVAVVIVVYIVCHRRRTRRSLADITTADKQAVLINPVYQSNNYNTKTIKGGDKSLLNEELPSSVEPLLYEVPPGQQPQACAYEIPSDLFARQSSSENIYNELGQLSSTMSNNNYEVATDIYKQFQNNDLYSTISDVTSPVDGFFVEEQLYWEPGSSSERVYQQLSEKKYREITRQKIQIVKHLGSGEFGTVHKGVWNAPWGLIDVAVKSLGDKRGEEEKVLFLREAAIMGQFHHPNIVKMHGVVTVGEPNMILLELMTHGDLRQYLQQYQPIPGEVVVPTLPSLLLEFSKHISSGMNYLSSKKFIHRDLAARNILVADKGICKIGDFGMARDLQDENYYISHAKKIPIKWTAPEALHFKRYSTASDVWSYGAVLYEIWSVGHKPFENCSNQECIKLVESGYRLPPPGGCPRPIYQLMIQCWNPDTCGRPLFSDIQRDLNQLDISQCNTGGLGGPVDSSLNADLQKIYTTR